MTKSPNVLLNDVQINFLELTEFVCNQIENDTLTPERKCELALELQKAKSILSLTITSLTTITRGTH